MPKKRRRRLSDPSCSPSKGSDEEGTPPPTSCSAKKDGESYNPESTPKKTDSPESIQKRKNSPEPMSEKKSSPESTLKKKNSPECTPKKTKSPESTPRKSKNPESTPRKKYSPDSTPKKKKSPESTPRKKNTAESTPKKNSPGPTPKKTVSKMAKNSPPPGTTPKNNQLLAGGVTDSSSTPGKSGESSPQSAGRLFKDSPLSAAKTDPPVDDFMDLLGIKMEGGDYTEMKGEGDKDGRYWLLCRYCKRKKLDRPCRLEQHERKCKKHTELFHEIVAQLKKNELRVPARVCFTCKRAFQNSSHLRRHNRSVHGNPYFEESARIESKKFLQKNPVLVRKNFPCRYCGKNCLRKDRIPIHEKMCVKKTSIDGTTKRHCSFCNKTYSSSQYVKRHELWCGSKGSKRKATCVCQICGKAFVNQATLRNHQVLHSGVKPLPCGYCSMKFYKSNDLHKHERIHTGDKPYPCKHCTKTFARSDGRNSHEMTHAISKAFQCEVCEKTFSQPSYVKIHMRLHTGEKPYKCDVCSESFITKAKCQRHVKKHNLLKCTKCEGAFMHQDILDKHMQIDHQENCQTSNIKAERKSPDLQSGNELSRAEDTLGKESQTGDEAAKDLSLNKSGRRNEDSGNQDGKISDVASAIPQGEDDIIDGAERDDNGEYESGKGTDEVEEGGLNINMPSFVKEEDYDEMEEADNVKEDEFEEEEDDGVQDDFDEDGDDDPQEDDEDWEHVIKEEELDDTRIENEALAADAVSETDETAEHDTVEGSCTTSESDEVPTTTRRRSSGEMLAHDIVNLPNASYDNFDVPTEVLVDYEDAAQEPEPLSDVEHGDCEHDDCEACQDEDHEDHDSDCSECEACQNEMKPLVESRVIQYITSVAKGCLKMDEKLRHELQLSSTDADGEDDVDSRVESNSTVTEASRIDEECTVNFEIVSKNTDKTEEGVGDDDGELEVVMEAVEGEVDDEDNYQKFEQGGEELGEMNEYEVDENEKCEETAEEGGDTNEGCNNNESCDDQNNGNEETNESNGYEDGNDQNEDVGDTNGEQNNDGGDDTNSNDDDDNNNEDDDEAYDGANEETTEEECEDEEEEDKFDAAVVNGVNSHENHEDDNANVIYGAQNSAGVHCTAEDVLDKTSDLSTTRHLKKNQKQLVSTGMTTDELPEGAFLDLNVADKAGEESTSYMEQMGQTDVLQSLKDLCENYEELSSGDEEMSSETQRKSQQTISEIIKKETEFLENFDSDHSRVDSTDSEVVIVKKPKKNAVNGFDNSSSTMTDSTQSDIMGNHKIKKGRPKKTVTTHNGLVKKSKSKNLLKVTNAKGAKKFIAKKTKVRKTNMIMCQYCKESFDSQYVRSHRAICTVRHSANTDMDRSGNDCSDYVPMNNASLPRLKKGRSPGRVLTEHPNVKTCRYCLIYVQKSHRLKLHEVKCLELKKKLEYLEQHPEVVHEAFKEGKTYRCPFCIKDCKARQRFEQHWRLCQQRKRRIEQVKLGLDVAAEYSCSYCVRCFPAESEWAKHEDGCRKLEQRYEEIMQTSAPKPLYDCIKCNQVFPKKNMWEKHKSSCTGPKIYKRRRSRKSRSPLSTQTSLSGHPPDLSQSNSRSLKRLTMDLEFEFVSPNFNSPNHSLRSIQSNHSSPTKSVTSLKSVSPAKSSSSKNGDTSTNICQKRKLNFIEESPKRKRRKETLASSPSKKTSPKRSSLQMKSLQLKRKSLKQQQQTSSSQLKRHSFRCRYCNDFCYNIEKLIVHERRCLFVKDYSELPSQLRDHFGLAFL